jgi:radical SAM protein with 4Fe4S-binding SPASM domain
VLVWELTLRCNARCRYCGSGAASARPGEMTTAECLRLADELVALGLEEATLSGGEPLLKDGFFAIAERLVDAGVRTDVVSNGLLIDEPMAARLALLGLRGVSLSFDGPEALHDELRGVPGGFERAMAAADRLRRADVPIGAITHVNRRNLPRLRDLAPLLADAGFAAWQVQLTVPPDGGPEGRDALLTPEELPRVVALIEEVRAAGRMRCYAADSLGYFGESELRLRDATGGPPRCWRGCHAGVRGIGITSDGGVLGCLSLLTHGDRFLEGNVRERPLAAIWHDPERFAYTRRFDPATRAGRCGACRLLDACRGGCTALLAAVDPEMRSNPLCLHAIESDGDRKRARRERRPPSVVIFVADGLRPDFLGFGGGSAGTPTIDRLAAEGAVFANARGAAAWTVPAVASLLTGTSPHRLGLVKWQQPWTRARTDLFSLFARHGYAVGSFPFDRLHLFASVPQARVVGTSWDVEGVRDWLVAHHDRPSLAYVHWWGTHVPYLQRPLDPANWKRAADLLTGALDQQRRFAEKLRGMYALAVRHLDAVVLPAILRAVDEGRGRDDTIFVLTADHGESWCERYPLDRPVKDVFDLHGRSLYEENLRVPLILRGGVAPGAFDRRATHMDLAATLARLCVPGADERDGFDGGDLFAPPDAARCFFAVADRDFVDADRVPRRPEDVYALVACLRGGHKAIRDVRTGRVEWYDLDRDPGETRDLSAEGAAPPELVAALDAAWRQAADVEWEPPEEDAVRRKLRPLGYL